MPLIFLVQESLVSKVALSKKEKKRKPEIVPLVVFFHTLFGAHYLPRANFAQLVFTCLDSSHGLLKSFPVNHYSKLYLSKLP